jgi:hypothetical protein
MAIAFVLDENIRGQIWSAICQHNARGVNPIDVTRVGDPPDLPLGTPDPDLLMWAARAARVVVTKDVRTLPALLVTYLQQGHDSPGLMVLRGGFSIPDLVGALVLAAHGYEPWELQDQVTFVP